MHVVVAVAGCSFLLYLVTLVEAASAAFSSATTALRSRTCPTYTYPIPPAVASSRVAAATTTTAPIRSAATTILVVRYNFLKDVFGAAFENDTSLSRDNKRAGMLDEADDNDEGEDAIRLARVKQLTSTQQAWRQKMTTPTTVSVSDIAKSAVTLDLFLTGIPSKDPTNDLYGSKINISSRDRIVGQVVPKQPTVSGVQVQFQANQKCVVTVDDDNHTSDFCNTQELGDWKLSDGDGRQIRFRLSVFGFRRTVQTKGTIQNVFGGSRVPDATASTTTVTTQTSTFYTIPQGWLYFEAQLGASKGPGKPVQWGEGIVKVEQSMGLLGAASRMIPCGKFIATPTTISVSESTTMAPISSQDNLEPSP